MEWLSKSGRFFAIFSIYNVKHCVNAEEINNLDDDGDLKDENYIELDHISSVKFNVD